MIDHCSSRNLYYFVYIFDATTIYSLSSYISSTALLEFSVDFSLDQRQTPWRKLILAAHPDSYKHHQQYNLADHQRGTCTLRGKRRRFVLKVEGLARVSKHAEKTTTSSDRGV